MLWFKEVGYTYFDVLTNILKHMLSIWLMNINSKNESHSGLEQHESEYDYLRIYGQKYTFMIDSYSK